MAPRLSPSTDAKAGLFEKGRARPSHVDVQADFWNGDPDIDAFCRMEHAPECDFDPGSFPMCAKKMGPFNSQNTFIAGKCLRDYFLFPHIGRMDDIWASYYVQAKGYRVVWNKASVYQERNVHDLVRDMKQEYLGLRKQLESGAGPGSGCRVDYRPICPGRSNWAFELYRRHFNRA